MSAHGEFIDYLIELLAPLGPCSARRMFGGWGIYRGSRMIGLVAGSDFYLKVDEQSRPRFAEAGCRPFVYGGKGKPIEMSYWTAPDSAMDAPDQMLPWVQLALAAAERQAGRKRAARPRPRPEKPAPRRR
jgi:DNA transformation protein